MQDIHIGPIPPPLGGISIYIYRLLRTDKKSGFINEKKFSSKLFLFYWLINYLFCFKKKNFISHSLNIRLNLFLFFFSLISIHKFSLVIHGPQFIWYYQDSSKFKKFLLKKMLDNAKSIQVINPEYKKFIRGLGIRNKNIIVKDAFLPPPVGEESKILKQYEKELIDFINSKNPLIVANAFAIDFVDNIDLYGLDMCVELTFRLKKDFSNIGFLYAVANEKINEFYLKEMKNRLCKLKISDNFYFMTGQKELWPIFKRADLMIRPTYIDGYGISIEEALYFNCPAIASDVCRRPKGTILFKNRDIEDLYEKSIKVLKENIKRE